MKKDKKIIIVVVLAAVILAYFLFFKNKIKESGATSNAIDSSDAALVRKMMQLGNTYIQGGYPNWILTMANENLTNPMVDPYYNINGRLTKAGALLATYDSAYFGYGYPYKKEGDEAKLHSELHALLQAEQRKYLGF